MSEGPAAGDSGLFGKLPRSRPGTRSPRRAAGAEPQNAPPTRPSAAPGVEAHPAEPGPRPGAAADEPPAAAATPEEEGGAGLEDLAWAGIAVTAEAATLGVRLFSRAIDAARKATERR